MAKQILSAESKALQVPLKRQKLSAIKEYEKSAENMGYDYVNNALLIGKDYIDISFENMKPNDHSVRYFKDKLRGMVIHEMGHSFHAAYKSEFEVLLNDEKDLEKYATTKRSYDTSKENVAEAFALYYIGKTKRMIKEV